MKNEKIIFVDKTISLNKIKNLVENDKNCKIITFDYSSHKNLLENRISHKISDEFLTKDEFQDIHNESFNLTRWFEGDLEYLLEYENVNLGRVFYVEFHHFLLQFLKKLLEIREISKKTSDAECMVSPALFEITRKFNSNIISIKDSDSQKDNFLDDSIRYRITNSLNVNISRSSYQRLKKSSDKIISNLSKNETDDRKKSVLFVEFNPIKYKKLFEINKKHSINLVLFNRRRPTIWNFKSYNIIKKSGCVIATYDDVLDKKLLEKIENDQKKIVISIEKLWKNEKYFESFFIFKEIKFWKIIKPIFINLCIQRMTEAIREVNITKSTLEKYNISSIVCWSENGFNEQIVIGIGNKLNKKIILLQHGLYLDSKDSVLQNEFSGVLPRKSNRFFVWGKEFAEYAKNSGVVDNKIEIIGNPAYDIIFEEKENDRKKEYVLIATTSTSNKIEDFLVKNKEDYENAILLVCKSLKKRNRKIVIKIHPFEEEEYLTQLVKELDSNIQVIKKGDIIPLIKTCEIFISIDMSTTMLEAQIINKPVISIKTQNIPLIDESKIFTSKSFMRIKIEDFNDVIDKVLTDEDYKSEMISKGSKFLGRYVSNQGISSERLFSCLEDSKEN